MPSPRATNSIIFLLVINIVCLCSTRDVYIQPSEGEHCPGTCYNITTFGKMADNFSNSSGLNVHFLEGNHFLDLKELVLFTNLTNAVFEGDGRMQQGFHETVCQSSVVIKCTENSSTGIAFVNSSNITFRYITITNCGAAMLKSNIFKFVDVPQYPINASLGYLRVINNIVIDHVSVQNRSGSGLLVITDGTNLSITDSSFAQNGNYYSGVLISHIDPLNCAPQKQVYKTLIAKTNISFGNNGGLAVGMLQRSYSVAIVLDYVTAYGNRGLYGNILISAVEHNVPTYNLTINNTVSSHGTTALRISSSYIILDDYNQCPVKTDQMINLAIFIVNSKFSYNNNSDPVMIFGLLAVTLASKITIESTEISNNIGSGVIFYLLSNEQQVQLLVTLSNVIAKNNSNPFNNNSRSCTIRTDTVTALVLHNVSITNNNMTGLRLYRTAVVVNGTSVFHNNTGIDGGGLAMYGESYLLFGEDSILNFINNTARDRGGAIFVSNKRERIPCFFQYLNFTLNKSANIIFSGNTAERAGTALFGGNISSCMSYTFQKTTSNERFNKTFNYSAQTGPSVISSEPTNVCFCDDNNTINCSQTQLTMTAYPGEEINISVVTVGQRNGVAPGVLEMQPVHTVYGKLFKTIATNCTTIEFKSFHKGYMLKVLDKESLKFLNISFTNCPLGFEVSNDSIPCACVELRQTINTITCNATTKLITRLEDIWIGNISDCVVVHTPCPFDYCNTAQVSFFLTNPDPQCALNRTGILCGRCQDGLSLALGSNNCIQCPQFSYLALIIPFAAAGFGLVALLMVLNLTVSIGTINGLIFYASIVKISESTGIFFPNGSIPVLSQFIAWLNLDLGIETCFYHGMTAYAKVWLQFVFPLYIWFIIATIIVLCRYSTWLSNKIGGNVVQVLATLILLSFTKIFRTFAPALTWITLPCKNENAVWYVDGNVSYFSPKHYILVAAAVLFLLLAVPYTLALLFDAVIEKYLTRIMFFRKQWIKIKPFIDAYHGPYKDNCRFWTGLLLLVRMSFTLVSLHLDTFGTLIFITASTTILLSLLVNFEGVYQKKYLNSLECLSFLNLGLLSALVAVYQKNEKNGQVVTIISVSVALVMFVGILAYHMFLHVKNMKCCRKYVIYKFSRDNSEESEKLLEDEDYVYKQLVQPTSSELCLKRETLIYS